MKTCFVFVFVFVFVLTALVHADPMTVTWIDNSGPATNNTEDGTNIYRSINGSVDSKVASVGPNITTFTEDVPQTNIAQKVCYSVAPFNKTGEAAKVAAATCKTVPALPLQAPAPAAKVELSFTGATGEITIDGKTVPFTDVDGTFKITAAKTMKLDAERLPLQ